MDRPTRSSQSFKKISGSPWLILAILSCVGLISMFADTMILPAIPDFIRDLDISYSISSWILASFLITGAVMTPIAGKLSDTYGKKKVLLIILGIYTIGITLAALSNNFATLLVARIIQGIGLSVFPIAFSIIRDIFPQERLAIAQGIYSSLFSAGAVIGVAIGGTIIKIFGWHATFLVVIPVGIILFAVISKVVPAKKDQAMSATVCDKNTEFCSRFVHVRKDILLSELIDSSVSINANKSKSVVDIKGAATLSATVVSFLVALQFTQTVSDTAYSIPIIIALGVVAIVSLILFVRVEKRTDSPLIDLKLLKDKTLLPANIINMVVGITALMVVYQTIPILIRTPSPLGFGGDALDIARIQLPYMIISLIVAIASGLIVSKFGNLRPTLIGIMISLVGFVFLFIIHTTEFSITISLAMLATGLSLTQIGAINIVLVSTPKQSNGVSLAMTVLLYLIGTSVGPVIAGVFMQMYQTTINGIVGLFPALESYSLIFLTAIIMSLVSVALVTFIMRKIPNPKNHSIAGTN
jgi:MFS family permease